MKTLKEFDYDLWTTNEDGKKRYFARVKKTGEVTEISLEVRRYLMSLEKQTRREEMQKGFGTIMSMDTMICDDDMCDSIWLLDKTQDAEDNIIFEEMAAEFADTLTPLQRSIFYECMLGGKKLVEYASEHNLTPQNLNGVVRRIRKKAKKFGGDGLFFAKKCPL